MPTANIRVTLKEGLFDAQGAAVKKSLQQLGHNFVQRVSIGKYITVEMDDIQSTEELEKRVDQMCRQLLANSVIEEYEVRLDGNEGAPIASTASPAAPPKAAAPKRSANDPFSIDYGTYSAMSAEERMDLRSQAIMKHSAWINQSLDDLDADWILVIGGEIVDSGETLKNYPSEERQKELGTMNNLVPWVFVRPQH